MGEREVVQKSLKPWVRADIANDVSRLGVRLCDVVIVHTKMSALGWICGGAQAVVQGLLDSVGPEGTIVMPAHSGANSDPARWENPPVPVSWWEDIRANMPAFDPAITPTRGIGEVPELFRGWPGATRSNHPSGSFSAYGKHAGYITRNHCLDFAFGDGSPLAKIYELDGKVLLMGVGYENCTSMHLGECRSDALPIFKQGASVMGTAGRSWIWYDELDMDSDSFPEIGSRFEQAGGNVSKGQICQAEAMLFGQREIVDFTAEFIRARRTKGSP